MASYESMLLLPSFLGAMHMRCTWEALRHEWQVDTDVSLCEIQLQGFHIKDGEERVCCKSA